MEKHFAYSDLDFLITGNQSYTNDENGNLLQIGEQTIAYHEGSNQIAFYSQQKTETKVTFNEQGAVSSIANTEEVLQLPYDSYTQKAESYVLGEINIASFYNHQNQRVGRKKMDAPQESLFYRAQDLFPSLYINSQGDETMHIIYQGQHIVSDVEGETTYRISDRLNSLRSEIDKNGEVISQVSYDDYGQVQEKRPSTSPYLYGNQYYEKDINLYHLDGRLYHPLTASFFSLDIANQGNSPYLYSAANPIKYTDIDGNIFLIPDRSVAHTIPCYDQRGNVLEPIRISAGSNLFKNQIDEAYSYLKAHGAHRTIARANESSAVFKLISIPDAAGGYHARFPEVESLSFRTKFGTLESRLTSEFGDTHFVALNLEVGLRGVFQNIFGEQERVSHSPAVQFVHEVEHARRYVNDPQQVERLIQNQSNFYGNEEEKAVILGAERNAVFRLPGHKLRNRHDEAYPFRTSGPSSMEAIQGRPLRQAPNIMVEDVVRMPFEIYTPPI